MLGAARRAHVRRTVHRRGRRGRRGSGVGVTGYTVAAPMEDWRRRAAESVEDRSRRTSREPSAGVMDRRRSGQSSGEPESTHRWTGTTCRAAPLACSDCSEERDVGRSRLDRVEGGGDNGMPGRTGRHPRLAVTRVLICAVGALVINPRDIISHRFTLSLYKGLSRNLHLIHQTHPCGKLCMGSDTWSRYRLEEIDLARRDLRPRAQPRHRAG
jgi:hypothetical protein